MFADSIGKWLLQELGFVYVFPKRSFPRDSRYLHSQITTVSLSFANTSTCFLPTEPFSRSNLILKRSPFRTGYPIRPMRHQYQSSSLLSLHSSSFKHELPFCRHVQAPNPSKDNFQCLPGVYFRNCSRIGDIKAMTQGHHPEPKAQVCRKHFLCLRLPTFPMLLSRKDLTHNSYTSRRPMG